MDQPEEPVPPFDEDDFDDTDDASDDASDDACDDASDDASDDDSDDASDDDSDESMPPLRMGAFLDINGNFEDYDIHGSVRQHLLRLTFVATIRRGEDGFLNLQDEAWAWDEPVDLGSMKEKVLAALEVNRTLRCVYVGYRFLRGINEGNQRRFFRALEHIPTLKTLRFDGLPGKDGGIRMQVLLESLSRLVTGLHLLLIRGITLSDKSEVELLADALGARGASLRIIYMVGIFSRSNEKCAGFLDPILHAVRRLPQQPPEFLLTGNQSQEKGKGPSLITVQALRLFLQSAVDFTGGGSRRLHLNSLGFSDEHCKVLAELLVKHYGASERALGQLALRGNPAIGNEGFEAILGLLNRERWLGRVTVDDKSWQAKFNLVAEMNTKGRGKFLQSGVFDSKIEWVAWLDRLAALDVENGETGDARRLNFLWYTLIEKPEFISH
jgi:hypothetical protein